MSTRAIDGRHWRGRRRRRPVVGVRMAPRRRRARAPVHLTSWGEPDLTGVWKGETSGRLRTRHVQSDDARGAVHTRTRAHG